MADRLTPGEVDGVLTGLPGWTYDRAGESLGRQVVFKTFSAAFGFIAQVALAAQAANHHPDWSNSYNRVTLNLSTHDAGGVTQKDVDLARAINGLL